MARSSYAGTVRAPDFPAGLDWLNTENHAVRKVDLTAGTVTTLAGTGGQARSFHPGGPSGELNSPWDLLVHRGKLYIAMAGPHQLWTLDLRTLEAMPYAGSGMENIADTNNHLIRAYDFETQQVSTLLVKEQ